MSCLIELKNFETLSSRARGAEARARLKKVLEDTETQVILDFHFGSMSPSFADECIGVLVSALGIKEFKRRIKLKNVSPSSKVLIKHVISKRTFESSSSGAHAPAI